MINKEKFLWIKQNFLKFFFYFFNKKNYTYRKYFEICVHSDKETIEISLIDLRNFDNQFYTYVTHEPLKCLKCFEFIILKIINKFISIKFSEKRSIRNIQLLFFENKITSYRKKILISENKKLISLKVNIIFIGKLKTKIAKINKILTKNKRHLLISTKNKRFRKIDLKMYFLLYIIFL